MSIFSRFGRGEGDRDPAEPELRARMVEVQVRRRGLGNETVLEALRQVPRHLFVPRAWLPAAYDDRALPIGHGQTISQPYIVALMTASVEPRPGLRVLEVGTGSGYQAAVLAACGVEVFTVERIPELLERARVALDAAGCLGRVRLRLGDGSEGWPEEAPFDRILITAAAERVPEPLFRQLAPGGILVAPVGDPMLQTIYRYRKRADETVEREALEGARFVPLVQDPEEAAPGDGERRPGEGDEHGPEG